MAKVHLLDDELINKIAAGEVVERPASVVKELVENAIDAGATQIKVSLKDGGRQLIQVQDDGVGMEAEDARLALKRHTTSKLQKVDDLFQVSTMGFRGEALASISSVSRLTLQTQTRTASSGLRLMVEDGHVRELGWQGPVGTSISVADLFYNVPARKAFLKTGAAEFAACHEYMQALALSMPQLGFTLLHNDKEIVSVGALPVHDGWPRGEQPLRARVAALFAEDLAQPLLYVHSSDRYARIEGLISAPGQDKGSAKYLFTFVNQRWVRDKLVRYGLLRGYHSHLLKGKFPIAFLFVDVDPALVDVNVHPAKAELRFQYGSEVQNAIALALREALRQKNWAEAPSVAAARMSRPPAETPALAPTQPLPDNFDLLLGPNASPEPSSSPSTALPPPLAQSPAEAAARAAFESAQTKPQAPAAAPRTAGASALEKPARERDMTVKRTVMSFDAQATLSRSKAELPLTQSPSWEQPPASPISRQAPLLPPSPSLPSPPSSAPLSSPAVLQTPKPTGAPRGDEVIPWDELRYIGAFANCFLLFEHQGQLLAIDQHAFHERVLYERLARDPQLLRRQQPLLMPEVLAFSPSEISELEAQGERFRALGIDYAVVNEQEIELRAVPSLLTNKDFSSLIHALLRGAQSSIELSHDVLATLACHAAVRAGEDLPEPELKTLLAEARTVDFYHNCPHGRRVFRWWKQSQVAAWFDRLS